MLPTLRGIVRLLSTSSAPYPFAKNAIIPQHPPPSSTGSLLVGKGLMQHLHKTLPLPQKQEILYTLFSRKSPKRIPIGSVLTVVQQHAPTTFTGILIAIRRRGIHTSFLLRNVIQGVGVEMRFVVASPHLKEIKLVHKAGAKSGKSVRRAKLYYLRDSPEKLTAIAAGMKG